MVPLDCPRTVRLQLTIHENVDEQDLHGIKRVAQSEERAQRDQRQRSNSRSELEIQEVLDVMEDGFACKTAQQRMQSDIKYQHTFFDSR